MKNKDITSKAFDNALVEVVKGYSAFDFLQIPGVYEIVAEHCNNEVLDLLHNQEKYERLVGITNLKNRGY